MKKMLLFAAFCLLGSSGCNRSDGVRLGKIGVKVADKVQVLLPDHTPFVPPSLGTMSDATLESRVRVRFQTDRYLTSLPIEIIVELASVRLKGQVDSDVLKQRAVEIAESTVGVEKVVDELLVVR
jgi:hypothetical protein